MRRSVGKSEQRTKSKDRFALRAKTASLKEQRTKTAVFCLCSLFFVLCSCSHAPKRDENRPKDSLRVEYAQGFRVDYFDGYKRVVAMNPWKKGAELARYYLVSDSTVKTPADGLKIHIPLRRPAITSCTHIEFLRLLGELETVKGVCSPQLVYNEELRQRIASGAVEGLGDAFNINMERALLLQPDGVMLSSYNNANASDERLRQASIPVIYNNEWQEADPLGRAEWIKFVGAFFDKELMADSIFCEIKAHYNEIRTTVSREEIGRKPTILPGTDFKGTWYMPGGRSYMSKLYADAGGNYRLRNDTTAGSVPLSLEAVVKEFRNADVWLGSNAATLDELLQTDSRYRMFDAVRNGAVYSFNARVKAGGANDFWESATTRPDLLLADIAKVLYPDLLPHHTLFYLKKLN